MHKNYILIELKFFWISKQMTVSEIKSYLIGKFLFFVVSDCVLIYLINFKPWRKVEILDFTPFLNRCNSDLHRFRNTLKRVA